MITLDPVDATTLPAVLARLGAWQLDEGPVPLHPGDLAWALRLGEPRLLEALRAWSRDGRPCAIGFLDGPGVLRLGLDPEVEDDEELAARLRADLEAEPGPDLAVELRRGAALQRALREHGWSEGEAWTPLRRSLAEPLPDPGITVLEVDGSTAEDWTEVLRSGFPGSTATAERWRTLTAHPLAARHGRVLQGRDDQGNAVAAAAVWSAGPGRPGLLEPIAVPAAHRRRGHGRAISLAAAAALRELGASSAAVATESARTGAVATYRSAGFVTDGPVRDLVRPA